MDSKTNVRASGAGRSRAGARSSGSARRLASLIGVCSVVIVVCGIGGLALGSHATPMSAVPDVLTDYDPTNTDHVIVVSSRIPRAVLAIIVGVALGLAGLLMQAITRNPLAEPGLFAVNAGASAAVVIAIGFFGIVDINRYIWFSFIGCAVAAVLVYLLGTARRGGSGPARMALAGAALSVAIAAATDFVLLSNTQVFNQFRFWAVGSLQGRSLEVALTVLPFVLVGVVLSVLLIRPLNAMALGEDIARGLGVRPGFTRAGAALAVVLLAGAATSAAGPIMFVGLAAPHIVRLLVGVDQRVLIPGVLFTAPAFVLLADVLGRWIIAPAELQTGIMAAILGGPVFVALVRSRRLAAL